MTFADSKGEPDFAIYDLLMFPTYQQQESHNGIADC